MICKAFKFRTIESKLCWIFVLARNVVFNLTRIYLWPWAKFASKAFASCEEEGVERREGREGMSQGRNGCSKTVQGRKRRCN